MKKCIRKCVAFVLILSMLLVIVPRNPFPSNLTFAKTEVELWNKNGIQILFSEDSVWEYGKDSTKINDPKNIDFLNNPEDMIQVLSKIKIGGGGGDEPETPIDAIGSALKLKFRKMQSLISLFLPMQNIKIQINMNWKT